MSSKPDWSKVDKLVTASMKAGLNELGKDVQKRAILLAPKDTGRLRASSKVDVSEKGNTVFISFNTPYANRRHWENNLHPATRKYLTNALTSIKNIMKYFKKF